MWSMLQTASVEPLCNAEVLLFYLGGYRGTELNL
jgi:hypothetical protein